MHPRSLSIVIEWENAALTGASRARRMLAELWHQLAEAAPRLTGVPEIVIPFDPNAVAEPMLAAMVAAVGRGAPEAATVRLIAGTEPADYYQQKNAGAQACSGEIVIFLDSDVVPEPGWLAGLLDALAHEPDAVVSGNTYVDVDGWYARAFAMFWFFPLREEAGRLADNHWFFANNVAFPRAQIRAHPFPRLESFRGQCAVLAQELRANGQRILLQPASRVAHSVPRGLYHFVARALCHGHDETRLPQLYGPASAKAGLKRLSRDLRGAATRIRSRRRPLGASRATAIGAGVLAGLYFTLKCVGYLISLRNPGFIKRRLPI